MPITDIGSYVTTGQEFESHWTDVDADRVANTLPALTLPDGYAVANLTADVGAVQAAITSIEDLDNALAVATANRDALKQTLRDRLIEFREAVGFRLKGSGYVRALPETPAVTASEQKTLKALDDMQSVWTRINADSGVPNFTPPLLLRGGATLAAFTTDVATMRTNYRAVTDSENDARIARSHRDVLLEPLRDRFVAYRQAISVEYGEGHPFVTSLPDVYPQPGSTPDPVALSGQWDEPMLLATFNWSPSLNPNLQEYQVRMSPGATYDSGSATVVGSVSPGTESFATSDGLTSPGNTASFKVFVVLTTGNVAGSNTVTITRP